MKGLTRLTCSLVIRTLYHTIPYVVRIGKQRLNDPAVTAGQKLTQLRELEMQRFRSLTLLLLVLALCVAPVHAEDAKEDKADAPPPGAGGPPPALVRVGEVNRESVQQMWDVVGRLREVRRAIVAAEQAGRIVEVSAEEGDHIEAGKTVLVRIDDVWAKIDLQTAEARLAQSKANAEDHAAQLEQATRDLDALAALLKASSAKPKEVDDARTMVRQRAAQLERAKAEVVGAEAELVRAKEDLSRLTVVAPFSGVVIRKMSEVGQWATAGAGVAEIISRGKVDAVIDVPEQYVNFLTRGDAVEVDIEPLKISQVGKVEAIIPLGSSAARTFPVKVRLDDVNGSLKPGMSVLAHVPTGKRADVLTVPRNAVQRRGSGDTVWINLNGQGMPVSVKVRFGVGDRYVVEPLGGGPPLAPGMQVVIEGAERLFPTRPLIVQPEPTAKSQ